MAGGRDAVARLQILGGFRLTSQGGRDATPRGAKTRGLIAYLALSPIGSADRAKLASLLWSESPDAKANLRQSIKEARKTFAEAGLRLFSADRYSLSLGLDGLWVDALELDRLVHAAGVDTEEIVSLYGGPLLDGLHIADPVFDDWLTIERQARHQQACDTLERALRRHVNEERFGAVKKIAEALLRIEPTHEEAHQALIKSYGIQRDYAGAARQYQRCREALARDLDVSPSPETEALLRDIRAATLQEPRIEASEVTPAPVALQPSSPRVAVEPVTVVPKEGPDLYVGAIVDTSIREALSRFRWFSVVDLGASRSLANGSAEAYAGNRVADPDYTVKIGLLRLGERVRLTAELRQVATGRIVWANHHDGAVGEVLNLADDLADVMGAHLERELQLAEVARARSQPGDRLSAHDCVMRATPLIYRMTPGSLEEADRLLKSAMAMDPTRAATYNWRAFSRLINLGQQWAGDVPAAVEEIDWLTRSAIEHDPNDAVARALRGHIDAFIFHNFDHALDCFDRCLRLNPSLAFGWAFSAVTCCYLGDTEEALRRLDRYRRLQPFDSYPFYFNTAFCLAYALSGQYEKAAAMGRRVIGDNPNYFAVYRPLIASLGHLGQVDEARTYLAKLLENEPHFTIDWFRTKYPPLASDQFEQYVKGLRQGGVPVA